MKESSSHAEGAAPQPVEASLTEWQKIALAEPYATIDKLWLDLAEAQAALAKVREDLAPLHSLRNTLLDKAVVARLTADDMRCTPDERAHKAGSAQAYKAVADSLFVLLSAPAFNETADDLNSPAGNASQPEPAGEGRTQDQGGTNG